MHKLVYLKWFIIPHTCFYIPPEYERSLGHKYQNDTQIHQCK